MLEGGGDQRLLDALMLTNTTARERQPVSKAVRLFARCLGAAGHHHIKT